MRKAKIKRKTKETEIEVSINLDGKGEYRINTSIPFMDHMLTLMAYHGRIDLEIKAKGDIDVDYHHLMEDMGIALGTAFEKAIGDKKGIRRFGLAKVPMDESLSEVVIDISGRPFLVYKAGRKKGTIKDLPASLFEDFFQAFTNNARINLYIIVHYGRDLHHIFESVFKAFGRALKEATTIEGTTLPSTKGTL